VFHLDHYAKPGLEKFWSANLRQAEVVAELFDDATIIAETSNVGYGESVYRTLRAAIPGRVVFWAEDDKVWTKGFSLSDCLAKRHHVYYFPKGGPHVGAGSTSPALWNGKAVGLWLETLPTPHERICEKAMIYELAELLDVGCHDMGWWHDIGRRALRRAGVGHVDCIRHRR
jgi:hypothetical protein